MRTLFDLSGCVEYYTDRPDWLTKEEFEEIHPPIPTNILNNPEFFMDFPVVLVGDDVIATEVFSDIEGFDSLLQETLEVECTRWERDTTGIFLRVWVNPM